MTAESYRQDVFPFARKATCQRVATCLKACASLIKDSMNNKRIYNLKLSQKSQNQGEIMVTWPALVLNASSKHNLNTKHI